MTGPSGQAPEVPQQMELAEQLYRVWRQNETPMTVEAGDLRVDPVAFPAAVSAAWLGEPDHVKAQWRALAEVYARLELYQINTAVQRQVQAQVEEAFTSILALLDRRETKVFAELHTHFSNPDARSDMVWSANQTARAAILTVLHNLRTEVQQQQDQMLSAPQSQGDPR